MGQIASGDILRLLKKYGIILITFELVTRFGMIYIIKFYHQTFPIEDLSTLNDLNSLISALAILFCDMIVGLIILNDLDKGKSLTWIMFGLTFLNPWMSVAFLLIWKVIDLKQQIQENNQSV